MISENMVNALNKQIEMEAYASFLYLSMASWANTQGLEGCYQFLLSQSDEERMHMLKIFEYINEVDGHALTPAISQPPQKFTDIVEIFNDVYQHEKKVTAAIANLVKLSNEEMDFTTLNFLQWYVEEQREEETTMRGILDKLKLIGDAPNKLYFIDKELEAVNKAKAAAEDAANAQ